MIAFGIGYNIVKFGKIVYSNTSPYSISTNSIIIYDPTSSSRRIQGLHVISSSILIAAYVEYNNVAQRKFYIGTVDFEASKIKYQETLPPFNSELSRVVFLSDTLYFVAAERLISMNTNIAA
jgi:hypothetical protein